MLPVCRMQNPAQVSQRLSISVRYRMCHVATCTDLTLFCVFVLLHNNENYNDTYRMDNYSSHESQLYCKAHHRQLLQPKAKFDQDNDVEPVTKSSELSLSLLSFASLSLHSSARSLARPRHSKQIIINKATIHIN